MKKRCTYTILITLIFGVFSSLTAQNQWDIRLQLQDFDCQSETACYNLELRSASGTSWALGSQNYRLFFDGDLMDITTVNSLLPSSMYSPVDIDENIKLSGIGQEAASPLDDIDDNLGFLDFSIVQTDKMNPSSAVQILPSTFTAIAQICVDVDEAVLNDIGGNTCIAFYHSRPATAGTVTSQVTVLTENSGPDLTTETDGVGFDDLTSADSSQACLGSECDEALLGLIKVGAYDEDAQTITYQYTISNLGEADLFDIVLSENSADFSGTGTLPMPTYVSGGQDLDGENDDLDLASGDALVFEAIYEVTEEDIEAGLVSNQATTSGQDVLGNTIMDLSDDNSFLENDPTRVNISGGPCGCQDLIHVTLGTDCTYALDVDQVGAGDQCNTAGYRVVVNDGTGADNVINGPGTYTYGIFDGDDEIICWGEVRAEDKTGPVSTEVDIKDTDVERLESYYLDLVKDEARSIDPDDGLYIGHVEFTDACEGEVSSSFTDRVEYDPEGFCDGDAPFGAEYVYARLTRTFVAEDSKGNRTSHTVTYDFIRPAISSDPMESAFTIPDNVEVDVCDGASIAYCPMPYLFGCLDEDNDGERDSLLLSDFDETYSIDTETTTYEVCGEGVKLECDLSVFDWCAGESQLIYEDEVSKFSDMSGPEFTGAIEAEADDVFPDDLPEEFTAAVTISTGPVDCTAPVDISDLSGFGVSITDECSDEIDYTTSLYEFSNLTQYGIPVGDTVWRAADYTVRDDIQALPHGSYALVIEAFDGCYNSTVAVVYFDVADEVSPVMKCDDELNVTLNSAQYAKVYASDVDENSWDNCELVSIEVRKKDTDDEWADYVEFDCSEVGQVAVELRGTDKAGNQSICWTYITLEDKYTPICTVAQPYIHLDCNSPAVDSLLSGDKGQILGVIGAENEAEPTQDPICGEVETLVSVAGDLDQCGVGEITLQWSVVVGNDTSTTDACEQVIDVVGVHDYWVKFPADAEANCDDGLDPAPENGGGGVPGVEFSENACDLIAESYNDERFYATQDPNACYKIFRTWKIINWCEYDSESIPVVVSRDWDAHNGDDLDPVYNSNPQSPDGDNDPGDEDIYVIVEVDTADDRGIVYYDNDSDPDNESTEGLEGDDDATTAEGYWWAVTAGDHFDPSEANNNTYWFDIGDDAGNTLNAWDGFDIDGSDFQDDDDDRYGSFGYWQYTQHIVVYDDVAPTLTGLTANNMPMDSDTLVFAGGGLPDCTGLVQLEVSASDNCASDEDLTVRIDVDVANDGDASNDILNAGAALAAGFDAPIDEHRLIITINDGCGNITVIERVFEVVDKKAPTPICINGLAIELMPDDEGGAMMGVWASDFLAKSQSGDCSGVKTYSINRVDSTVDESQDGVLFTCADIGMQNVEIHAWDGEGNHDFCVTFVEVQDNRGHCSADEGDGEVAGAIATEENASVEGVEVELSGARSMMYVTDNSGSFNFTGLETGHDYTITPQLDRAALNGVSTFDLILISKHILGVQPLNTPYKMIAADVNNSKTVTTLDLIQLRKLILNIDTEFSNNTSWRFVDADYNFSNPANPLGESFPEVKNINNLTGDEAADFVAIKIGDVNGSALGQAQPRSGEMFTIEVDAPQQLRAGETYEVTFTAEDLSRISGYQFTLQVEGAEILDLQEGLAQSEHFGVFREEGVITSSWNTSEFRTPHSELFTLVLRAEEDASTADILRMSSRYTAAEAYNAETNDLMGVALQFGEELQTARMELYQNVPNPFQEETRIGFFLPQGGEADLIIRDGRGRLVRLIEGEYAPGYNEVRINRGQLPAGLLNYTLRQGDQVMSRTMILKR